MKRNATASIVIALLLGSLALTAVAAGSTHVLMPGCVKSEAARYKPTNVIITCGDGGFRVQKLKWSSWTRTGATGSGTGKVNTCDPNCASGKFKSYPVTLTLSKRKTCSNGKREFVRLKYTFPGKFPAGARRSETLRRPCSK